jgi:putative transcriptional regulator
MIRFRLMELMAEKQFREGRRTSITEMAEQSGVSRVTLSKMINQRGYCTGTDTLDKLCEYFDCELVDLAEYVREVPAPVKPAEKRSGKAAAVVESKGTGRKSARKA